MKKFVIIIAVLGVACGQTNDSSLIDPEQFPGEDCFRDCRSGVPRVCYFNWHLEHYHVLGPACGSCGRPGGNVNDCFNEQCITADGYERGVMSINRKIPGPPIHVCKDDLIVVDVTNAMGGTSAAIHWHGFHQRKTPHFDGVPFITQCPIEFSTTFRYAFHATEPGTQFYHSHSGHHKVNGHYGGIVVRRDPRDDPSASTYDYDLKDHLMVVSDWMKDHGEMFMPGLRNHAVGIQPTNFLINGKGTIRNATTGRSTTGTPLEVFRVERGQRYRFRLVNSVSHVCPVQLEVENHSLLVIASDSFDLQPVAVDSLVSNSGERYDFVLNANQTGDTFWIRVKALGPCAARQLEQFAVLTYLPLSINSRRLAYPTRRFPDYAQPFGNGSSLNHPNTTCGAGDVNNFCITDLQSHADELDVTGDDVVPDYSFNLAFHNHPQPVEEVFAHNRYGHFMNFGNQITVGAINNISFVFPSYSPLTQPNDIDESHFCDESSLPSSCEGKQICPCVYRLKVKLNSIVELLIIDDRPSINDLSHPFHLHGYKLFVMDMGQHPERSQSQDVQMTVPLARAMNRKRKLLKSTTTKSRPIKDTISIPSKGYTVFRFKADNPGWWLLHCHYEWHLAVGMGLVVQVGESHEMVKPPEGFPKCNNFKPSLEKTIFN